MSTRLAAAAALGLVGAFALVGCASTPGSSTPESPEDSGNDSTTSGPYADGTYTAQGSYATPESVETISVTLTLADEIVTDVTVVGDPQRAESAQFQGRFIGGISDEVVGQPLAEVSVSRVAGSSLTSGGFTEALEAIKADAAG